MHTLACEAVVNGMVDAFEKPKQSAAMIIVKKNAGVWLNNDVVLRLQVDDSEEPLKELRRVVEKWNATQRRRR